MLVTTSGTACVADSPDQAVPPTRSPADTERATTGDTTPPVAPPDEYAEPDDLAGAVWTAGDTRVDRAVEGAALLREVRTARHEGFDRIVLDFGTDDVPAYGIAYIDRPIRQCGSGDAVPLAGDAWLSLTVRPADAHTEQGEPTVRERERSPRLPALLELKLICDFEAVVEVVAGVTSPERYRAFVLTAPNRLVVDIRHPSAQ